MNEVYEHYVNPITGKSEKVLVGYNILDARNFTVGGVPISNWASNYDGRYGSTCERGRVTEKDINQYPNAEEVRRVKDIPRSHFAWHQKPPRPKVWSRCGCGATISPSDTKNGLKRCNKCRKANRDMRRKMARDGEAA